MRNDPFCCTHSHTYDQLFTEIPLDAFQCGGGDWCDGFRLELLAVFGMGCPGSGDPQRFSRLVLGHHPNDRDQALLVLIITLASAGLDALFRAHPHHAVAAVRAVIGDAFYCATERFWANIR